MWPFLVSAGLAVIWGFIFALVLLRAEPWSKMPHKLLCWLFPVLPFASGGFYAFLAFPVSVLLLVELVRTVKGNGELHFFCNGGTAAIGMIGLFFGISVFWAVDKGMAPLGFVKFIPVLLLTLLLMQMKAEERMCVIKVVPLSGVVMTLVSIPLMLVPAFQECIAPDGRLAGLMEYPNTYALFLLVGLVQLLTEEKQTKKRLLAAAVLMFGILASGSRTSFILLVFVLLLTCGIHRNWKRILSVGLVFVLVLGASFLLDRLELLTETDRYLSTSAGDSSFLTRLIYYQDTLRVALKHPFGLGYMGWAGMRGYFQTGVYHVTYVHNGVLQLLADVGWIPTLLLIYALFRAFFARNAGILQRLVLIVIMAHSMMDFDFQFLTIWFLLIPALELHSGKKVTLRQGRTPAIIGGATALLLCLWLGTGEFLYSAGQTELCLSVMPFHSFAIQQKLTTISDVDLLDETADQLLAVNSCASIGHSAKANAAYGRGDILTMMREKEEAIRGNPYDIAEYTDYFNKLWEAMRIYQAMGDSGSAEVCRGKLLEIPDMLEEVLSRTTPLAWCIQHTPDLELPSEYQSILENLR